MLLKIDGEALARCHLRAYSASSTTKRPVSVTQLRVPVAAFIPAKIALPYFAADWYGTRHKQRVGGRREVEGPGRRTSDRERDSVASVAAGHEPVELGKRVDGALADDSLLAGCR